MNSLEKFTKLSFINLKKIFIFLLYPQMATESYLNGKHIAKKDN